MLGKVPFRTIFAESCNTGFVGQAKTLSSKDLAEVAQRLGYRELDLGVPVFGGSVPVTDDLSAEHGADMIGQGKVQASPLAPILTSHRSAAEPVILTLSQIKRWPIDPLPANRCAFVVENPAIVAAAANQSWDGPVRFAATRPTTRHRHW